MAELASQVWLNPNLTEVTNRTLLTLQQASDQAAGGRKEAYSSQETLEMLTLAQENSEAGKIRKCFNLPPPQLSGPCLIAWGHP